MRIEYPRGSGQVAEYDAVEVEEMHSLRRAADAGRMPRAEAENACRLIHEAKVYAGARIVSLAEQARDADVYLPPPDSPFQIPAAALADLVRS